MRLDAADLNTETFTNSQGWTVVRVTHVPSGLAVERQRTRELQSPVQAQSECVKELEERVGTAELAEGAPSTTNDAGAPVTRAEFNALVARVSELERELRS
jgi:hypothetical protein